MTPPPLAPDVRIDRIELRMVRLDLVSPFRTSFGEETVKECIVVRAETSEGISGWGECVAFERPLFNEEFNDGAWIVLRDFLAPAVLAEEALGPQRVAGVLRATRGHRMAKSAIETAVLDASLRSLGASMREMLGGERDEVEVGVSIGIQSSIDATLKAVASYLAEGYRRIKLKIEPGWDADVVSAVRTAHPDILLSVDANAAYALHDDGDVLRALDDFDLLMIEQPFHHEDLRDHATLQRTLRTSICLDESIRSLRDAQLASDLGSCRIINIKPGRVGGYLGAKAIHDLCLDGEIPVWCGGMFETGLGRAANLALASLPGFTLPGDISASGRYFIRDLTEPFIVSPDGMMAVPTGPGIGVEPLPEILEESTLTRVLLERGR